MAAIISYSDDSFALMGMNWKIFIVELYIGHICPKVSFLKVISFDCCIAVCLDDIACATLFDVFSHMSKKLFFESIEYDEDDDL